MTTETHLDVAVEADGWHALGPDADAFCRPFVERALAVGGARAALPAGVVEVSVLLTDDETVARLNADYRGRSGPTNVLSFALWADGAAADPSAGGVPTALGDIVLAFETSADEARTAGRTLAHHTAHLLVHGTFHLLGFDHEAENDAARMEALETAVLADFGIDDPYASQSPIREMPAHV